MNRNERIDEIDVWLEELRQIDRKLDGYMNAETGEKHDGALDILETAELDWLEHRDAAIADLTEGDYKGRQLPGNDRLDALARNRSEKAREVWQHFRHFERMTKRLRERADRLQTMVSGRQSQVKGSGPEAQSDRRGLPQHGQARGVRRVA